VDRDQRFLVPPDLREWLPADHLVWFVLDVVAGLDLAGFRAGRRWVMVCARAGMG
jgi:hypothetical protein